MDKVIVDTQTGEVTVEAYTADELKEREEAAKAEAKELAEQLKVKAENEAKKTALLEKLGITEQEAKLLLQ